MRSGAEALAGANSGSEATPQSVPPEQTGASLAQEIWRRYGSAPGVIRLSEAVAPVRRLGGWVAGHLPLPEDLTAARWTGTKLDYSDRRANRRLKSQQPSRSLPTQLSFQSPPGDFADVAAVSNRPEIRAEQLPPIAETRVATTGVPAGGEPGLSGSALPASAADTSEVKPGEQMVDAPSPLKVEVTPRRLSPATSSAEPVMPQRVTAATASISAAPSVAGQAMAAPVGAAQRGLGQGVLRRITSETNRSPTSRREAAKAPGLNDQAGSQSVAEPVRPVSVGLDEPSGAAGLVQGVGPAPTQSAAGLGSARVQRRLADIENRDQPRPGPAHAEAPSAVRTVPAPAVIQRTDAEAGNAQVPLVLASPVSRPTRAPASAGSDDPGTIFQAFPTPAVSASSAASEGQTREPLGTAGLAQGTSPAVARPAVGLGMALAHRRLGGGANRDQPRPGPVRAEVPSAVRTVPAPAVIQRAVAEASSSRAPLSAESGVHRSARAAGFPGDIAPGALSRGSESAAESLSVAGGLAPVSGVAGEITMARRAATPIARPDVHAARAATAHENLTPLPPSPGLRTSSPGEGGVSGDYSPSPDDTPFRRQERGVGGEAIFRTTRLALAAPGREAEGATAVRTVALAQEAATAVPMVLSLQRAAAPQPASAPDAAGSTPLAVEAPSSEADIAAADREQADLERLADLVYAIIERRLKFERENLGL